MLPAKEKAKELVGMFKIEIHNKVPSLQSDLFKLCIIEAAKQCAIRAVDEIIKSLDYLFGTIKELTYYREVKKEIEKL
jgi:hypothetical protein